MRSIETISAAIMEAERQISEVAPHRRAAARRLVNSARGWLDGSVTSDQVRTRVNLDGMGSCGSYVPVDEKGRNRERARLACERSCREILGWELEQSIMSRSA